MIPPAAIAKAESLRAFALEQGAQLETFGVCLSLGEGYELLDYLAAGGLGRFLHHDQLVADIEEARVKANPWLVLDHFQLAGLSIIRADSLN
jgi:hypothetical protein